MFDRWKYYIIAALFILWSQWFLNFLSNQPNTSNRHEILKQVTHILHYSEDYRTECMSSYVLIYMLHSLYLYDISDIQLCESWNLYGNYDSLCTWTFNCNLCYSCMRQSNRFKKINMYAILYWIIMKIYLIHCKPKAQWTLARWALGIKRSESEDCDEIYKLNDILARNVPYHMKKK